MGMCRCLFAAKRVLCMYVCTNAATMPYSSDKRNQTTVILAALHLEPQPKADHKTPLLKRSTHKAIAAQQPQTDCVLISCISYKPFAELLPIIFRSLYRTKASKGHSIWTAAILAQETLHESVNLHTHVRAIAPYTISEHSLIKVSVTSSSCLVLSSQECLPWKLSGGNGKMRHKPSVDIVR